jgi:hypothetical protein
MEFELRISVFDLDYPLRAPAFFPQLLFFAIDVSPSARNATRGRVLWRRFTRNQMPFSSAISAAVLPMRLPFDDSLSPLRATRIVAWRT